MAQNMCEIKTVMDPKTKLKKPKIRIDSENSAEKTGMSAERTVQMNSVLTILSDSIEKLKISLILPRLLERPCILRKVLDNTKYSHCLKLIEDYINERQDSKDETSSYLDYRLIKIIDFFHINTNILELLPGWMDELDDNDVSLLKAFKLLRWITEQRLNKSAVEELKKEKKIHEIFHENEKFKKNIEASVARRRELEEELRMTKVNYEKLVNDNIRQEKNARAEKNKLLLQLEALIKKFDQSIGDKMREKIVLEEEYAKQKKIFDEFMIIFREKEAEYEVAVVQKEQEEREQQEKKLAFFIMNRAARIIQRFYRKYRKAKKRLEKQLQKRGKGAARRKGKK
uniref:Dynein regulatory complex protein 10 n=1 Tax=Glossina palpalis gambiensis TaxID=67801 RepID=A0A1B0BYI3_9MUSC